MDGGEEAQGGLALNSGLFHLIEPAEFAFRPNFFIKY